MKLKLFKIKYKDGATVFVLASHVRTDPFMDMIRFFQEEKEVFAEFNHWIKPSGILMTELD